MNAQRNTYSGVTSYSVGEYLVTSISKEEYEELLAEYKSNGGEEYEIEPNRFILYLSHHGRISADTLSKYAKKVAERHASYNEQAIQSQIIAIQSQITSLQFSLRRIQAINKFIIN